MSVPAWEEHYTTDAFPTLGEVSSGYDQAGGGGAREEAPALALLDGVAEAAALASDFLEPPRGEVPGTLTFQDVG